MDDQRLLGRAIRENWIVDVPIDHLKELSNRQETITLKELAVLVVRKGLTSPRENVAQMAVSNLLRMNGQNQNEDKLDILSERNKQPAEQHLHIHGTTQERLSGILKRIDAQLERLPKPVNPWVTASKSFTLNSRK